METNSDIAFIGFGEAAQAFCEGWGAEGFSRLRAYDRKSGEAPAAEAKRADYVRYDVDGRTSNSEAVDGAGAVISVVTADQALAAAVETALTITADAFYFDMNSVSPATKRQAALAIEGAGARYVDVAVMSPVRPALLGVPILLSGPHATKGHIRLRALGFEGRVVGDEVGAASAIKMIRSIVVKGIEALTAECVLSAYAAGVENEVFSSLDASFPGFDWRERADYNLDRMIVHGRRRAEEMKEAAATAERLGQTGVMASATAGWHDRIGQLSLPLPNGLDAKVETILRATGIRT